MTSSSVPAAREDAAISAYVVLTDDIVSFEGAVTEALASRIECTYGDASGVVELHADTVEAGFEDRAGAAEIAAEIDAQSRVGGGA